MDSGFSCDSNAISTDGAGKKTEQGGKSVDFSGALGPTPRPAVNFDPQPQQAALRMAAGTCSEGQNSDLILLVRDLLQQLSQFLAQWVNKNQSQDSGVALSRVGSGSGNGSSPSKPAALQNDPPTGVSGDMPLSPSSMASQPAVTTPPVTAQRIEAKPAGVGSPATSAAPADALDVTSFGAVGDGKTDNTEALNHAMSAAKQQGKSVFIPEGTFNHSGVINVDGVKVEGAGMGTELHATDPDHSAIKLTGDSAAISDLKTSVNAPGRSSQPEAAGILLQGTTQASVKNCMTVGAASNGIRLDGASRSTISNDLVTGSNADGIAMMNGSMNNHVTRNVIDQAGDDAISSDSYVGDAAQNRGNLMENNAIQNNRYGRAAVSMGGADDVFRNNFVRNQEEHSVMAGGTDANSDTMQGSGSVFEDNHINDGSYLDLQTLLGWNPGQITAASAYTDYVAGTGAGANNTAGNRT